MFLSLLASKSVVSGGRDIRRDWAVRTASGPDGFTFPMTSSKVLVNQITNTLSAEDVETLINVSLSPSTWSRVRPYRTRVRTGDTGQLVGRL